MFGSEHVIHDQVLAGGETLQFNAVDIRKERTGVHAKVGMFLYSPHKLLLGFNNFNIERLEDRNRFANSAHKAMGSLTTADYPVENLRHDFDVYCANLWNNFLTPQLAQPLNGNAIGNPITFLAKPHIIQGGGTILFAPPGRGKSFTALLMAVSIDAGVHELWEVEQVKTMFVNLERGGEGIARRLGGVNTALGLDPARPLLTMNARGKSLLQISEIVQRSVVEFGVEHIVLDSISRAGLGDLTENKPANAVIDQLNSLTPTWLGLAHTPRANENHIYGSTFFEAGADIVVQMLTDQSERQLAVGLQITKANDIGKQPIKVLTYQFDEWGIIGAKLGRLSEHPALIAGQEISAADEIFEYFTQEIGKGTATQVATALNKNRSQVAAIFKNDTRFIALEKNGRDQYYGCLGTSS